MGLTPRLEIRQRQGLVMTQELMQAIKMLPLSNVDLMAVVDNLVERNPLLEKVDPDTGDDAPPLAPSEATADPVDGDWLVGDRVTSREAIENDIGTDLSNVFPDDTRPEPPAAPMPVEGAGDAYVSSWSNLSGGRDGDEGVDFESFVAADVSLADHLEAQLSLAVADPRQRLIGRMLVDMVDETGYLTGTVEDVADRMDADPAEVEAVLAIVQGFDPPGVAARSLRECLAIQLRERNRLDPAMATLLDNLELVARRDLGVLRRLCRVDEEDLRDMLAEIRALTPKPGLAFGSTTIQPVVPDVLLRAAPDGSWIVELNQETLPRVLVNQTYYSRIWRNAKSDQDRSFLTEAIQTANWLTRSLEQRARTILKVATEIVRQQDAFFAYGVRHLRPLNLKTVADAIEMHESTVSRVTANKYIATSRGVFELKYFFTASIASSDGSDAHSAEAVRHRIKAMIDAELPNKILSDDTIVQKLAEDGVEIARRTVAKYREAMRIPSSVDRRREKSRRD